ncbi:RD3 protein [Ditylenchus destructor]|nr:RD3 protein [Ditylenchus destructor]
MAWFNRQNSGTLGFVTRPHSARQHNPDTDTSGDVEAMMVDLILGDIQTEISRIEQDNEKKRQECLKEAKTPDYGWLMDWRLKSKKILDVREMTDIELLCAKVKPNEWNRLIRDWRGQVKFVESREEVIDLFRNIVNEIVHHRCHRQTSLQFIDEEAPAKIVRPRTTQTEFLVTSPPSELSVFALTGQGPNDKDLYEAREVV